MATIRWIESAVVALVLGSGTIGVGETKVLIETARSATLEDAGYCSIELARNETAISNYVETPRSNQSVTVVGRCPTDMVEVVDEHCQVVEQICETYISETKDRCEKFRNRVRCLGRKKPIHVCIDRYEYPNRVGEKPTVAVTFTEAAELCAAEGKRLCTADEWTQACEGPEHLPYPYGFTRDDTACNHDKPYRIPNDNAYQNEKTRALEIARLDQSEPSGSRAACVSAYGVYDMTGNVDEWVRNESGSVSGPAYESGLKGGYWGPVRNRCRPMTTDHNHWHHGYQIGFRCCSDPGGVDESITPAALNEITSPGDPVSESMHVFSRS
jgi:hypothetical protein